MDSKPLVSIAMATYNGERFLKEQLDSILNQTYQNIEIIICDDCSKDNTRNILKEYSNIDTRIKIYFNELNLGYSKNFQNAISKCHGDFIALSDQDDIWESKKIELSLENIKNYDILCTNCLFIDEKNKSLNMTMKNIVGYKHIPKNQEKIFKFLCHKNFVQGSTVLARASFIKKIEIPENMLHDYCYAICATKTNGITYLDKCLLRYRQHSNQVTTNKKKKNDIFAIGNKDALSIHLKNKLNFLDSLSQLNLTDKQKEFIELTKKYFENQRNKNLFTLKYYITNYDILYFEINPILKIIRIIKKTLGLIIHTMNKLFNSKNIQ